MEKVIFTHKNGREERMQARYAKVLQGLKLGTYQTRDMRAAQPAPTPPPPPADPLAGLSVTELRTMAKKRNITGMSKAPPSVVIEALKKCED